jgi:hypothetical protein
MGYGVIDPEYGVREGWVRDSDNEISMDGYNCFIAITTTDGTSGLQEINGAGAITFEAKSNGDGYVARRLGIKTYNPSTELEVIGKTKTDAFQMPTGASPDYVLTSDAQGNGSWQSVGSISLPPATCCGQVLFSIYGTAFTAETPLTSRSGWMTNNSGTLLVTG